MRSRAARLTLLILFIVSLGASAYLFWKGESMARAQAAALRSFEESARRTSRALLDMRAAQQAYVAAGQSGEFWPARVGQGIDSVRKGLIELRGRAGSPASVTELEAAVNTLDDFAQLDRRAREYSRTGQNLLASDLVFGDGLEMTGSIDARLEEARSTEIASREAAVATFRDRQIFALTAGAAAATLIVLLLLPAPETERRLSTISSMAETAAPAYAASSPLDQLDLDTEPESWSPPMPLSHPEPHLPAAEPVAEAASFAAAAPAPEHVPAQVRQAELPRTDFRGLASLCTDLARLMDSEQLPSLLDRASTVLDARGIILWIADPDGRELNPIVAHGYPAQLVTRLGTIPRDAENATAAAFRTSLLQTVDADDESSGAIAAPLVTPGGCVGVMAAELRWDADAAEARLAAAAIVAAQLATLVGPPARTHGRAEAAGA